MCAHTQTEWSTNKNTDTAHACALLRVCYGLYHGYVQLDAIVENRVNTVDMTKNGLKSYENLKFTCFWTKNDHFRRFFGQKLAETPAKK